MLYKNTEGQASAVCPSCPTYEMQWADHYTTVQIRLGGTVLFEINPKDFTEGTDLRQVVANLIAKREGTPDHFYIELR